MDLSVLPQVTLWMPDMGHGSTPTQVSQLDTGTYRASEVFFVMPGLRQIKCQESTIDEAVATYTF